MTEIDKPKSAREIWTEMVEKSTRLKPNEREAMNSLDDDLVELAVSSRNAVAFFNSLPKNDANTHQGEYYQHLLTTYGLIRRLLNERNSRSHEEMYRNNQ